MGLFSSCSDAKESKLLWVVECFVIGMSSVIAGLKLLPRGALNGGPITPLGRLGLLSTFLISLLAVIRCWKQSGVSSQSNLVSGDKRQVNPVKGDEI